LPSVSGWPFGHDTTQGRQVSGLQERHFIPSIASVADILSKSPGGIAFFWGTLPNGTAILDLGCD
jgi:hypothetical protein